MMYALSGTLRCHCRGCARLHCGGAQSRVAGAIPAAAAATEASRRSQVLRARAMVQSSSCELWWAKIGGPWIVDESTCSEVVAWLRPAVTLCE